MTKFKLLLIGFIILHIISCSVTKNQNKGSVFPSDFDYETEFKTIKSVIILPFDINGVSKNFIFDTGADYSLIQRDSMIGKIDGYGGASKRKMELGKEIVSSMKIGTIDFKNTIALNGDMKGLKEQIPNFGGLIGQPIIKKANWLIDYPNSKLKISNKNLVNTEFEIIKIKEEEGSSYTFISINGIECKVIIDFGSSTEFSLPKDSKLAKYLLEKYDFSDNKREQYTLGGLQTITEKVGKVPLIKLETLNFENVETKLNNSSQPRIGIKFFKDCQIYIDNINNSYRVKKTK